MKNALIVTILKPIGEMFYETLNKIFGDHCNFYNFSTLADDLDFDKIQDEIDLCLFSDTIGTIDSEIVSLSDAKLLALNSSFSSKRLDFLKNIIEPKHFIFKYKYRDTCIRILDILRDYGIRNFTWSHNPSSFTREKEGYKNFVITEDFFDDSYLLGTNNIEKFNLGARKISFKSLIEINNFLELNSSSVYKKILNYTNTYASADSIYFNLFKQINSSNKNIDKIISHMENAICFVDNNFYITNENQEFKRQFNINNETNFSKISKLKNLYLKLKDNIKVNNFSIVDPKTKESYIINTEIIDTSNDIIKSSSLMIIIENSSKLTQKKEILQSQLVNEGHVAKNTFDDIIAQSNAMKSCIEKSKKISSIDKTTLILGETGVGKELFAQAIHNQSKNKDKPFVAINCAAIPGDLLESELFGYKPGTFTGASAEGKKGLFELADGGTLFLDEIGELDYKIQSKLLRALDTKEIMKLGGSKIIKVNIRIIAATNRDLSRRIKEKKFRSDLYFRINNFTITVPSLRDRDKDIIILSEYFMIKEKGRVIDMSDELRKFLLSYSWPGNVRELKNIIEYMVNLYDSELTIESLPEYMINTYRKRINKKTCEKEATTSINKDFINLHSYDLAIIKQILIILTNTNIYSREELLNGLKKLNLNISDYKLRKTLLNLKKNNLIYYSQGPGQIILTSSGLTFLDKIKRDK